MSRLTEPQSLDCAIQRAPSATKWNLGATRKLRCATLAALWEIASPRSCARKIFPTLLQSQVSRAKFYHREIEQPTRWSMSVSEDSCCSPKPTRTQRFFFYTVLFFALGTLICFVAVMTRIVPGVEKIFIDFDATLPVMTQIVIMASHFLVRYWWLMLLLVIPLFLWLLSTSRTVSANTLNLLSLLLGFFTIAGILVSACILFALFRPLIILITELSA